LQVFDQVVERKAVRLCLGDEAVRQVAQLLFLIVTGAGFGLAGGDNADSPRVSTIPARSSSA
jgi:hypothetical protein